jgi:glycosyltransferase involved in cell wall biosynthesis
MRVLLTSPSMDTGGMERMITMLATALVERGHEVALVAPHGVRDGDLTDVSHIRIATQDGGRSLPGNARSTFQLARALRRISPDIVHAHNVRYAFGMRAAEAVVRPKVRPPVLATFHGVPPAEYRRSSLLLKVADHVVGVSQDLLGGLRAAGLPASRTSMIYNAISPAPPVQPVVVDQLERELDIGKAPVVAIVGRLVVQKAHERFVVAARIVADQVPEARFLIVGDGPTRKTIEGLVSAAQLDDRVRFTGVRSDAREIIARAQIVAFSSDWEGLSVVALEALAAGTPVVSTDVEGMRELFDTGAGALVQLDDGRDLGLSIAELLQNDEAREEMGEIGRDEVARRFSVAQMLDSYESLYEDLARSGRTA